MTHDAEFDGITFNSEWVEALEIQFNQYMDAMMTATYEQSVWEGASAQPFCGCETCITREILAFLVPRIARGFDSGFLAKAAAS